MTPNNRHGLHTITFNGYEIVIHYHSPPDAELVETLTIYCNNAPKHVSEANSAQVPESIPTVVEGEDGPAEKGEGEASPHLSPPLTLSR